MDFRLKRLYEAAHAGDVDSLNILLEEDKLLLDRAVTTTEVNDNPLHIAAFLGHAAFAREILKRKPKLACEFNSQHMAPLHLAAAQGHLHVAAELLQIRQCVDADLCHLRENRDGYLPVHLAVIKRRHDLGTMLIEKCEDCLNECTYNSETLLHLAVKANMLETVEFLTARGTALNAKDSSGNTSLHLAFAARQQHVIKHLLSQDDVDVNPINSAGHTPLDVLLVTNLQIGDLYLGETIRASGGKTTKELKSSETNHTNSTLNIDAHKTSQAKALITWGNRVTRTTSSQNTKEKETTDRVDNLMVVAALVATVTFAAALNPPGGVIQMPYNITDRSNSTYFRDWKHMKTIYPAGSPVYLWKLNNFFVYDCLALLSSVSVILLCLCHIAEKKFVRKCMKGVLWLSILFMVSAFLSALTLLFNIDQNSHKFRWFKMVNYGWKLFFFLTAAYLLIRAILDAIVTKSSWLPSPLRCFSKPVCKAVKWVDGHILSIFLIMILFLVCWGIGWGIGWEFATL